MLATLKRLPANCVLTTMKSPVGTLWLVASDRGLHALLWETDLKEKECKNLLSELDGDDRHPTLSKTVRQLKEYFSGKRKEFDLPLVLDGTSFQKKAWRQLQAIPYGKTVSYQAQATAIGDSKKARAVGTANSRNPIGIIVPCHRVIAKSGALSGFGGGLHNKKLLIELESSASQ